MITEDSFGIIFDIKELSNGCCYIGIKTKDAVLENLLEDGLMVQSMDAAMQAIENIKNGIVRVTSSSGLPIYRMI